MNAELAPSSFNGITEYPRSHANLPAIPGQAQGVYITLSPFVDEEMVGDYTVYGRNLEM